MSKNSSEHDILELFGLRTTSYLSENCFIEMSTGRMDQNCAFVTALECICYELMKLNGTSFQKMRLKVQETRQSDTSFNKRRNIAKFFRNECEKCSK